MAKKVAPRLKEKLKDEEPRPKELTTIEFEQLERYRLLKDLRKQDLEVIRLKGELIEERRKLFTERLRLLDYDKRALGEDRAAVNRKMAVEDAKAQAFQDEIRKRLGIEGRFGYDPDTLEVLQA